MRIKGHALRATRAKVRVPAACLATTARSVPMRAPTSMANMSLKNMTVVVSANCSAPCIHAILPLNAAELLCFLQDLWNMRGFDAVFFEDVRGLHVFAEHDLFVQKASLFSIRKRCEARERMDAALFDERKEAVRGRIIPTEQGEI